MHAKCDPVALKQLFFQKIRRTCPAGSPQTLSVRHLSQVSLLNMPSTYRHFHFLSFGLSFLPLVKFWLIANTWVSAKLVF